LKKEYLRKIKENISLFLEIMDHKRKKKMKKRLICQLKKLRRMGFSGKF